MSMQNQQNNKYFFIEKKEGETPLEVLEKYKIDNPDYSDIKMTYAGRLDPMACGKLLVLFGEECKKKDEYLGLDKEYEFEVMFGVSTDTYDILGFVDESGETKIDEESIKSVLNEFEVKFMQDYPAYSSKTVDGKPLFQYARDGDSASIPQKEVEIYNLEFLGFEKKLVKYLEKEILERIKKVKGDFRQEETMQKWKEFFEKHKDKEFCFAKFRTKVSSGTYIRSLSHRMGDRLGTKALAYKIKRTKIYI